MGSKKTHGMSGTRIYYVWNSMRQRCSANAVGKGRKNYYDRGIRVCERWSKFSAFFEDMGLPPKGASIDRIDNDKGYSPENCRWLDKRSQNNNKTTSHFLEKDGVTKTVTEWSEQLGIKANTIIYRIRRGWSPARALDANAEHTTTLRARERDRSCLVCGGGFRPRPSQIKAGRGLYCSQACHGIGRTKRLDQLYGIGEQALADSFHEKEAA